MQQTHDFMFEYGCFVSWWSNFDIMIEALICKLRDQKPKDTHAKIGHMTSGRKIEILHELLIKDGSTTAADTLMEMKEFGRNDWIHGTILNPKGDFSKLTLLRSKRGVVTNKEIDLSQNPFSEFYELYEKFEQHSPVTINKCNDYIIELQQN